MQNSIDSGIVDPFENLNRKALGNYHRIGSLFNENNESYSNLSVIGNKDALENTSILDIYNNEI